MNLDRAIEHVVDAAYVHATGSHLSRFFTALRDECAIHGARCARCGKVVVPPSGACELCGGALGELVRVGPGGVVRGMTQVAGGAPRAVVRVRLDGANTDLVHFGRDVARGMRVAPVWAAERSGTIRDIVCFARESPEQPSERRGEPVATVRAQLELHYRQAIGEVELKFREGLVRGEIGANRCAECGSVYVPPRPFCPSCFVPCGDWRVLGDTGTVTAFVTVNVPFTGQEIEIPYVLAHVQLDGADATFFHLIGATGPRGQLVAPPGGVRAGMRVRAGWRPEADRRGLLNDDIDHFDPAE
jgi:uncharacterized OB-fold protein